MSAMLLQPGLIGLNVVSSSTVIVMPGGSRRGSDHKLTPCWSIHGAFLLGLSMSNANLCSLSLMIPTRHFRGSLGGGMPRSNAHAHTLHWSIADATAFSPLRSGQSPVGRAQQRCHRAACRTSTLVVGCQRVPPLSTPPPGSPRGTPPQQHSQPGCELGGASSLVSAEHDARREQAGASSRGSIRSAEQGRHRRHPAAAGLQRQVRGTAHQGRHGPVGCFSTGGVHSALSDAAKQTIPGPPATSLTILQCAG